MTPILAEISDKMPSLGLIGGYASIFATTVLLLGIFRWWLASLTLPVIILVNYGFWSELHEPVFGGCLISEMGWSYVWGRFIAWNMPFLMAFVVVAVVRLLELKRKALPGDDTT